MTTQNLLVELFVEELPPKSLRKLGEAFSEVLASSLKTQGLAASDAKVTYFASPRRLAVHVMSVAAKGADHLVSQKLMPVTVGLDSNGKPTPALLKRLQSLGADASAVTQLKQAADGKSTALFFDSLVNGVTLTAGLQKALEEAIQKLPVAKLMTYQLEQGCEFPGWSSVSFVRPAHSLIALHGSEVVNVAALGLKAGNSTQGHRFEARVSPVLIPDADSYASTLAQEGAVIASFSERRAEIARQLNEAAHKLSQSLGQNFSNTAMGSAPGLRPIEDDALLDEVTALVERPNVLACAFEPQFLEVPQECLILTMKANQKYFPLLDQNGKLTPHFLVVSNISPLDPIEVISGNERVVRPRLSDAKFFFDQDRKKTLVSRVESLDKVVYHNKLGSQGDRIGRVRAIARVIAQTWSDPLLLAQADQAAHLAKSDLVTEMVGEFPELQGIMGGYYARNDGLSEDVAQAIEDHYKPRFAGDALPRNKAGLVVALADKLETLVGMFGIGNLPTGDKDPFALRRHALGVIRMLIENNINIGLDELLQKSVPAFAEKITDPSQNLSEFIFERLAGLLKDQGYRNQEVDAVLALRPQRLGDVTQRLDAVRVFASLPESSALAAANKRIGNILKKTQDVDAHVSELLLKAPQEQALYAIMKSVLPQAQRHWEQGDYTASLQTLAQLRLPVDAFFDGVMVNAEELDLRLNRLGLLKCLHVAMNRVADLSRLAA